MDDYTEVTELFPTLVLLSSSPPTWKGFLTVVDKDRNYDLKVKIKLIVPSFPRLENLEIYFGETIARAFDINFKNQIETITEKSESLTSFLHEVIILIVSNILI